MILVIHELLVTNFILSSHSYLAMLKGTAFVVRGTLRTRVFKALKIERNPVGLAKLLNKHPSSVSDAIADLKKARLVRHTTPRGRKSSFYIHTKSGRSVFREIQRLDL